METKPIKQSVINTFNRVGINYSLYDNLDKNIKVSNRFSFDYVITTALIAFLVNWVYNTSNLYESGNHTIKVSDFDRVRYFILEQDQNAYNTCID